MTSISDRPWLRAWSIIAASWALLGGILLFATASNPDTPLSKVAVVLTAPGAAFYFLVGCSPHTDACGPAWSMVVIAVPSGLIWAAVLVGAARVATALWAALGSNRAA
jgi:hypothetical protein